MESSQIVEILLVEDNDDDANLAIRSLKKNNLANYLYRVGDGEEALNFLFAKGKYINRVSANKPKVILLDLKMPKVSGLEVLKTMRTSESFKNTPVVIMTSSKEDKDITESYNLGVNSYIVKPVDFNKFTDAIKEIGYYWLVLNQPLNN